MKRIEKSWMALPCLFDWALLATSVTMAPASSTWRCDGRSARSRADCRSSTSVFGPVGPNGSVDEVTSS